MKKPRTSTQVKHESGVVLLIALVMLVVIGLASVAIVRTVSNTDTVSENARRQNQAMQAAQAALLYCEQQIAANQLAPAAAATSPSAENWLNFSKWIADPAKDEFRLVPTVFLQTAGVAGSRYGNAVPLPRCMAQQRAIGSDSIIVVTARGFSDDFQQDVNGRTQTGATVWLQSFIRFSTEG